MISFGKFGGFMPIIGGDHRRDSFESGAAEAKVANNANAESSSVGGAAAEALALAAKTPHRLAMHSAKRRSEIDLNSAVGRSLSKICKLVLRLLSFISPVKAYYKERLAAHRTYLYHEAASHVTGKTLDALKEHVAAKEDSAGIDGADSLPAMPIGGVAVGEVGKTKHKHTISAQAANANKMHEMAPSVKTAGVGEMKPQRCEGVGDKLALTTGQVTPTSSIKGLGTDAASMEVKGHLMNVYTIKVDGKDYGIIRTGVINTKQRADEFLKLLTEMHDSISHGPPLKADFKMRVLSQQLNSYENPGEKNMIESQHALIAGVNQKFAGKGEVMHINTPSNCWYDITEKGVTGFLLKFLPFKIMGKGEQLSKEQNMDNWSTMVKWVSDDLGLKDVPSQSASGQEIHQEIQKDLSEIATGLTKIADLKAENDAIKTQLKDKTTPKERRSELLEARENNLKVIDASKQAINICKGALVQNRALLKELHKQDYQYFVNQSTLRNLVEPRQMEAGDQKTLQMSSLMSQILGSQLNIAGKQLDRGKEGMAIQLLSGMLGVTSAMNCKSGLDRTGLWHAVKVAMESADHTFPAGKVFAMVDNWETRTKTMNRLMHAFGSKDQTSFNAWLKNSESLDEQIVALTKKIDAGLKGSTTLSEIGQLHIEREELRQIHKILGKPDAEAEQHLKHELKAVIVFRKLVFDQLMRAGLPITAASTGMMGMKWNKGWGENLIPLNFLPPFMQDANGETVQLVKYSADGQVTGLGNAWLRGDSSSRGS